MLNNKKTIKTIFFMILSNLLYALSFNLFFLSNKIAAGGFGGVATALSYILPFTPGLLTFMMTLPFLIWGGVQKGWLFSFNTFLSSMLFSIFEDALLWLPALTHNPLLAAVFGGILYGMGTICMLKAGISAGGTDLVAQLIRHHFPHITHGTLIMIFNVICVAIAIVTFQNLDTAFYSMIAIYVAGTSVDFITSGKEKVFVTYIITQKPPESISKEIEEKLHRGVTLQQGLGMYHKEPQNILISVIKHNEICKLQDIVNNIDHSAFVVFTLGSSAHGGGFQGPKGRYPEPVACTQNKGDEH